MKNNIIIMLLMFCGLYNAQPYQSEYAQERIPESPEVTYIHTQPEALAEVVQEPDVFEMPRYNPEADFHDQCHQFMLYIISTCDIKPSDVDENESKLVKARDGEMIQFDEIDRYVARYEDGGIMTLYGEIMWNPYIILHCFNNFFMRRCGVECEVSRDIESFLHVRQETADNITNAFLRAYYFMARLHELPADGHIALLNLGSRLSCFKATLPMFKGLALEKRDIVVGFKNIQERSFKKDDLYKKCRNPKWKPGSKHCWLSPGEYYEYVYNIDPKFVQNNVHTVEIYKDKMLMLSFYIGNSHNPIELIYALLKLADEI